MTPDPTLIEQELLPCPKCGNQPKWVGYRGDEDGGYGFVECGHNEDGHFCGVHADTEAEAIATWNTRTLQGSAALPSEAMIEVMRDRLDRVDMLGEWLQKERPDDETVGLIAADLRDCANGETIANCAEELSRLTAMRATTPTAPDQQEDARRIAAKIMREGADYIIEKQAQTLRAISDTRLVLKDDEDVGDRAEYWLAHAQLFRDAAKRTLDEIAALNPLVADVTPEDIAHD